MSMSLITSNTSSSAAAAVTLLLLLLPSPGPHFLRYFSTTFFSNLFQHLRTTFGTPCPCTHITTFNTRISSPLFYLQPSLRPTLAELDRQLPLRLQCPSPISDLQYLTSPRRLHSICQHSSRLDTATSARKATPSAWASQTPTSSSLRDLGGDTDILCLPRLK